MPALSRVGRPGRVPVTERDEAAHGAMLWSPGSAAYAETPPRTLAEGAMRAIYNDIVSARLAPGLKLKPEALKDRYGIGTSPIREALLRLSAEGLVRLEGQRGFSVPETSEAELLDIGKVRGQISVWALRLSIENGDDRWEASVIAAFHRLERIAGPMKRDPAAYKEEWELRNREFHAALEAACGSPWLLRMSNMVFTQSERYRRHTVEYDNLLPAAQDEHHAIMTAAINRDPDKAARLLTEHITLGVEKVRVAMRRDLRLEARGRKRR